MYNIRSLSGLHSIGLELVLFLIEQEEKANRGKQFRYNANSEGKVQQKMPD